MRSPFNAYVGNMNSVPLYRNAEGTGPPLKYLLWGDGVHLLDAAPTHGRRHVRARGAEGWVAAADLRGEPLLEVYFIDVGQGDGVLVRTPDFRHLLIDGGFPRASQPSLKSAADFVDWKFATDYGVDTIAIDALIASHNDHDHYGGLDDLLDVAQNAELDASRVTVEHFFHAGLSWWKGANGRRTLGLAVEDGRGDRHFVQLLGERGTAAAATDGTSGPQLQGAWAGFIAKLLQTRTAGGAPTPFTRLSQRTGVLPGFEGGPEQPRIEVLGPLETTVDGRAALRRLGEDSLSTNGHSVLLRLSYGNARLLITGDLNKAAQQALLAAHAGQIDVFACDVAKCCHHGSEDVSLAFLQAMQPAATVISSGDAEGHDHPRPRIVAASGATGHVSVKDDQLVTPLVYSTEIARSTLLGKVESLELGDGSVLDDEALRRVTVNYRVHKPGALRPAKGSRRLGGGFVVAGLVYGLVNVRTDGRTVLCATLNEAKGNWTIKTFKARFG